MNRILSLLLIPILCGSVSGCAKTPVVLLKEFKPSLRAATRTSLAGKTICVKAFQNTSDVQAKWTATRPTDVPGYELRKMDGEEEDLWDAEVDRAKETSTKKQWILVDTRMMSIP
jgi:hypothetical protein